MKRNHSIKSRGGKLISIESYVLGFIVLLILMNAELPVPLSCIIAFIVGFVFPILVSSFKTFAWISTVALSLIWGILSYIIASSITHNSVIWGLLVGIIVFTINIIIHKKYFKSMFYNINENTTSPQTQLTTSNSTYESVTFCPKCGRRIHSVDGKCNYCD